MDHLAIDLFSMETSQCGKNYVLVVVDLCTRFTWLYPLATKHGLAVGEKLRHLFMTCGRPRIIQSDNGSEFANLDIAKMLAAAGVDHRRISVYYPQADGAVERAIRTVKETLRAVIHGDTAHWPEHIAGVQYAHNTSVNRRHGSTPFSLFFARDHFPLKGEPGSLNLDSVSVPLYGKVGNDKRRSLNTGELKARFELMNKVVFPAISSRTEEYSTRVYDEFMKRHKIIKDDFPPGALVMKQVLPRANKATPAWDGPYFVVRRNRGGSYLLRDATGCLLPGTHPISQLRLVSYENNISPDSFEVEKIISHRGSTGNREYLIRWKRFSEDDDSWVPAKGINSLECIVEYWDSLRKASEPVNARPTPRQQRVGVPAIDQAAVPLKAKRGRFN